MKIKKKIKKKINSNIDENELDKEVDLLPKRALIEMSLSKAKLVKQEEIKKLEMLLLPLIRTHEKRLLEKKG